MLQSRGLHWLTFSLHWQAPRVKERVSTSHGTPNADLGIYNGCWLRKKNGPELVNKTHFAILTCNVGISIPAPFVVQSSTRDWSTFLVRKYHTLKFGKRLKYCDEEQQGTVQVQTVAFNYEKRQTGFCCDFAFQGRFFSGGWGRTLRFFVHEHHFRQRSSGVTD